MFRFTIRDVLWLTVVAALTVGWFVEHRRAENAAALRARVERLEQINAAITAAWQRDLSELPPGPIEIEEPKFGRAGTRPRP